MKKSITTTSLVLLFLLCSSFPLLAQQSDDQEEKKYQGTTNDFSIDLGFNNYFENGSSVDSDMGYAVKPWGSWFVALNSVNNTQIDGKLHLLWGGGVSFNTFKYDNASVRLERTDDGVLFNTDPVENAHKAKMDVAYLNISAVPMLQFGDHTRTSWFGMDNEHMCFNATREGGFRIGAGGYAGYRLGSKAKYVTKDGGDKQKAKDHDSFYLNNWRYGVRLQVGYSGMDLFVNYDLNELFSEGRGPELHAFSFGIVL